MINNRKVCGLLGLAMKAGKVEFGTEACMQGIEKNKIKLIIIGIDTSERTKMKFRSICSNKKIHILECLKIEEISETIGKANKAIIGIKDTNFAREIVKIVNGGEAIG